MTVIRFVCSDCHTALKVVDPTLVGRKIKCPMCKTIVMVPAAPALPQPEPRMKRPEPPTPAPVASNEEDEAMAALMEAAQEEVTQEQAAQNGTLKAPAASNEEDEAMAALMEAAQEEAAQNGTPKAPAPPPAKEEDLLLDASEDILTEAPPARKSASKLDVVEEDDLPPRKRGRKDDDEEDDRPARGPKGKPAPAPKKQRGNLLMAIFVVLVTLAYGGALGATMMGTFDEKPPATMTEDEALKVLKLDRLLGKPKGR